MKLPNNYYRFVRAVKALLKFVSYFTYNILLGYLPTIQLYDEGMYPQYILSWYAPETSHLKLHYYMEFVWRTQSYEFVYAPPCIDGKKVWVGPDCYDSIPF